MSQRGNYFKIGIFVIVGIAILVAGLLALGARKLLIQGVLVETYLNESVQGLSVGSPIKFRGVEVGKVTEITLVGKYYKNAQPEYRRYVLVRGELMTDLHDVSTSEDLKAKIENEIREGMRVRLASQGITGLAYIEIDYLDTDYYRPLSTNWEPEVPYVPSAPSRLTQIGESVEKVAIGLENVNIQEIADKIDKLIATVDTSIREAKIDELSEESVAFIHELRETNDRLQAILSKPEIDDIPREIARTTENINAIMDESHEDVVALIDEFRETSRQLQNMSIRLSEIIASEDIEKSLASVSATTENIERASADLPDTLASLDRTVRRLELLMTQRQDDMDLIIDNLRNISENINDMTDNAGEYPSMMLLGEPPPEMEPNDR